MRIQHNIMAMNAYRNYNNNTKSLSGNLEKLSSGYKINRAGDDAAGLAISEKMRAQITGLDAAQKNVKDGISLVKTAEGAMQEIQDMLGRMKYLATQSANGTYQNEVDRDNLNKEVTTLKAEINRIAESANFNGIQLLDGSLSGAGSSGGSAAGGVDAAVEIAGDKAALADTAGTPQETTVTFTDVTPGTALKAGDKWSVTMEMSDGTKFDLNFEMADATKVNYNGVDTGLTVTSAKPTGAQISALVAKALQSDEKYASFVEKYTPNGAAAGFKFTSAEAAFGDPSIKVATVKIGDQTVNLAGSVTTEGKGDYQAFDTTAAQVYDAADKDMKAEKSIFTVNGQKFAFAKDADSAKALGSDVNVVIASATTPADTDAAAMVALMNQKLGTNFAVDDTTDTTINMINKAGGGSTGSSGSKPLTLQIGDTSDDFNKMKVSIGSMKTGDMGKAFTMTTDGEGVTAYSFGEGDTLDSISIGNQEDAARAIETIKNSINYVSSVRGDLGALQNRLDHTANNLSVMAENIQDAESTIRDTDVANEMMSYVKNNILVQSAQAMLAQANQVPQGVLQLLG